MRIVSTTVLRHAPVSQGGRVQISEWPSGRVLAQRPVVPVNPEVSDPNPRGNSRGGRGVVVLENAIVVANYHSLEICDQRLQIKHSYSLGNFAGIHEVMRRGERLLIASTANNAAVEVTIQSVLDAPLEVTKEPTSNAVRIWWPTEEPRVSEQLGLPTLTYPDKQADNRLRHLDLHNRGREGHLHLNAVDSDGVLVYALLNKPGVILRLNDMAVVLRDPMLEGAHNLEFMEPGLAWVVSTRTGRLLECDLNRGSVRTLIDLAATPFARGVIKAAMQPRRRIWQRLLGSKPERIPSTATARTLFWRGLAVNEDAIFVGTSPAAILGFDRRTLRYAGVIRLSLDSREVVHGIALLP